VREDDTLSLDMLGQPAAAGTASRAARA